MLPSMQTVCGSAAATGDGTEETLGEALSAARAALGDRDPDLCVLFASPRHPLHLAAAVAHERLGCDVLSCSSAGEIADTRLLCAGVSVLLIAWGDAQHALEPVVPLEAEGEVAAEALTGIFPTHASAAAGAGLEHGTTLMLGDGLSPDLETLVAKIRSRLPQAHDVVGAGAADDGDLRYTFVGSGRTVAAGSAVTAHVASKTPWGVGVGHGTRPTSAPMTVTAATHNVVHELDGRPALDVYRELAANQGVSVDTEAKLRRFLVGHEIGVHFFDEIARVRAPIGVRPEGGVAFVGEVPEGATVSFVNGTPESYVEAAREAARMALAGLEGATLAGVLVFSCITRGRVLGERYPEELEAIREVFGDVPTAGLLSYGEIARIPGKLDGFHNSTLVLVAIPA